MAVLFSDDFSIPGSPPVGWIQANFTADNLISSGRLVGAETYNVRSAPASAFTTKDVLVEVTVQTGVNCVFYLGMTNDGNLDSGVEIDIDAQEVYVDGSYQSQLSYGNMPDWSTPTKFGVKADGTTGTLYVNDVEVGTFTLPALPGFYHGIATRNNRYYDDFSVSSLAASVPDSITDLVATPGDAEVTLSWSAPGDGGSAITDYEYRVDGGTWSTTAGTAVTFDVTGLTNGVSYDFEVRAVNAIGSAGASNVANATPFAPTVPATIADLSATPGDTQVTLSWSEPSDGGSTITDYEYRVDSGTWTSTAGTTTSFDVTGLTNDTGYSFEVRAVNAVGSGLPSNPAFATPTAPPSGSHEGKKAQYSGTGQALPTTAWANIDVGSTLVFDDDSIVSVNNGVYTPQIEGYYLVSAQGQHQLSHNNRLAIEWQLVFDGSTPISGAVDSGYGRNSANQYQWLRAHAIVYFDGLSDTVEVEHRRDSGSGTPSGTYSDSRINFLLLSATNAAGTPFGHYQTPSSTTHGGAFSDVSGWDPLTETDTSVIEMQPDSTNIRLKEANRPYLISYGVPTDSVASGRTQRISRIVAGGNVVEHSVGYAYQRDAANQYAVLAGIALVRPAAADQDITLEIGLRDDVRPNTWATMSTGYSWDVSSVAGRSGLMVLALPTTTEIAIFENDTVTSVGGSGFAQDLHAFQTEVELDAASFTNPSTTELGMVSDTNLMAYASHLANRDSASGSRNTIASSFHVDGVENVSSRYGTYLRGDQGSQDTPNAAFSALLLADVPAGDNVKVQKYAPSGQNVGNTSDRISYGGGFAINLDTLSSGAPPSVFDGSYVRLGTGTAVRVYMGDGDYATVYMGDGKRFELTT